MSPATEVFGDATTDHLAEAEERVAVGDQLCMDLVMGDEDDCDVPTASHPLDGLEHLKLLLLPEGGRRFVENEHPRPEEDGASDSEALPSVPPDIVPTACSGSAMLMPILAISCWVMRFISAVCMSPKGRGPRVISLPTKKLRVTEVSELRARSWYTVPIPASDAARGVRNKTGWPSR